MENSPCCNSVAGHKIATNVCTCHDSTAVVPCWNFCSDHCIRLEGKVKRNIHQIGTAMENPLVKRGSDHWLDSVHIPGTRNDTYFMMTSSNGNIFRVIGHLSPLNSPHKGQSRRALMFSLICVWINGWVNNRVAGNSIRYQAHYDVILMSKKCICSWKIMWILLHLMTSCLNLINNNENDRIQIL